MTSACLEEDVLLVEDDAGSSSGLTLAVSLLSDITAFPLKTQT